MNKYIIEYSNEAREDLIKIKRYIKYSLHECITAEKLVSKINLEIEKLKNNPKIYAIIDDEYIKRLEIRKIVVDNYIVFYRIYNYSIQIVRIMYGRRNWTSLL